MVRFFLVYVLVVSVTNGYPFKSRDEPKCSKFDYEEKLLEKMIRMEMKVEKILEEVKDKENDMMSLSSDLTQKVGNMEYNAKQFQRGINQTMTEFADSFAEEKAKVAAFAEKSSLPMIGFSARMSSTKSLSTGEKIVYDTVITNQGEGYNKATGMFIAPYTRLYFFSAHVCNKGNNAVHYSIYEEGTTITTSTHLHVTIC